MGGWVYRRAVYEVVLGCGVAVMEQVPRGSRCDEGEGGLLPATMVAVGALQRGMVGGSALQRGCGAVVVRMEAGTRAGSTGEWWGQ
jgi:hypothetical protein